MSNEGWNVQDLSVHVHAAVFQCFPHFFQRCVRVLKPSELTTFLREVEAMSLVRAGGRVGGYVPGERGGALLFCSYAVVKHSLSLRPMCPFLCISPIPAPCTLPPLILRSCATPTWSPSWGPACDPLTTPSGCSANT